MSRDRRFPRAVWAVCLTMVFVGLSALCLTAVFVGLSTVGQLRAGETMRERRAQIEQMDAARKAELARAQEQFAALKPAERQRLRQLHDQIEADSQCDELLDVMERYCEWVKTLTPYQRAELRELPPAERIERIKELREGQEARRIAGWGGMRGPPWGERLGKLASQEREALGRWLDDYMDRNLPELVKTLPEAEQKQLEEELNQAKDDPARRRGLLALVWVRWQFANRGKRQPLDDQDLERLRSQLSPAANQSLEQRPPDMQRRFLAGLISNFAFAESYEELAEYLQKELKPEDWDWLTSLPPEQMRQQLWWRYLRSKWPEDMDLRFPEHGPGGRRPRGLFKPPADGPPGPLGGFPPGPPPGGPLPKERPEGIPGRPGPPNQ